MESSPSLIKYVPERAGVRVSPLVPSMHEMLKIPDIMFTEQYHSPLA